mmetsp:Transcript_17182/g.36059  ORF Transcript_17182/g.36059 Transcript_17182/m.36059 type:complete len:100 (-) Transcript_17182:188-487(-)
MPLRKEVDNEREDTRKAEMAPERERERLRRPEEESFRARRSPKVVRSRSIGGTTDAMEEIEVGIIADCKAVFDEDSTEFKFEFDRGEDGGLFFSVLRMS